MSAYDRSSPRFDSSSFGSGGYNKSAPHPFFSSETSAECGSSSLASPPCYSTYKPANLSPLKRKRESDTLSATLNDASYSVYISNRNKDHEAAGKSTESPPSKKAKLHHKAQITTGSGEVEYHAAVCEDHHASRDISLPVRECDACRRIDRILALYLSRYQQFRHLIRKAENLVNKANARSWWDRSRCALANYKADMEKARIQVPAFSAKESSNGTDGSYDPLQIACSDQRLRWSWLGIVSE
ncbi:hypothetical protein MMC18_004227 [Xylographa bjoerkii]|nr:hypothetical protein [Xylographa bjoerkii]